MLAPETTTEEPPQAGAGDEPEVFPTTTVPSADESTTSATTEVTHPVETTSTTGVCASEATTTTEPDSGSDGSSTTTGIGATSTTAPDVSAPPTTTPTEVADSLKLAGTLVGESPIFEPNSQQCPQLRHRFDADVVIDGEPGWSLRENYCGVNDGETWQGSGTFEFTGPASDSFAGTFTSRVDLPTTGEPYRMTVTKGTGRFGGLAGTCDVDNHLENTTPGRHRQYGTFTCELRATP